MSDPKEKLALIIGELLLSIEARRIHHENNAELVVDVAETPELESLLYRYYKDPISEALKAGISDIGQIICKYFTLDEMQKIAKSSAEVTKCIENAEGVLDVQWDTIICEDGRTWHH